MESLRIVEAALFSASKPLHVADMAKALNLNPKTVREAIRRLVEEYEEKGSAMEIRKIGSSYDMRLREEMQPFIIPFAEREVPAEALKTAAMVAYHQPVLQSDLARMLDSGVYDHVRTLRSLGLVRTQPSGHTLVLTTTKRFCEYFGIESTGKEDIKRWMESRIDR